jgi:hypothetical protein
MSIRSIAGATLILALAGCATYAPAPSASYESYGPPGAGSMTTPATGASLTGASGSVSGGSQPAEKEQRGNTPPGMDRDGHGPAAGAILDPTGAATRSKPY